MCAELIDPQMRTETPFTATQFDNPEFSIWNSRCLQLFFDIATYCYPSNQQKSLRMFLRSLYWGKSSFAWYQQIARSSLLSQLATLERNLPEKLHREILRNDHSIDKRLQILVNHYSVVEQLIAPILIKQALLNGGLLLASIEISPETRFELKLAYGKYPSKEGELSINMYDGNGYVLVRLCFSLSVNKDGNPIIYIGGLQGCSRDNARELVNTASKSCHGLAPRRIAMEALFASAKHINAVSIFAVSDQYHISNTKLAKFFSYDAYWKEFDAELINTGDFSLPLVPSHKEYEDTPRKRRAKYRRQHEILEFVNTSTLNVLAWRADF
jgi:uncharacterized protein VirK/YbjX